LRGWLHLDHFENSLSGAWQSPAEPNTFTFFTRTVYGDAVAPLFQEIEIALPDRPGVFVASIPGTLLFFTGYSPSLTWSILPSSTVEPRLEPHLDPPDIGYDRLVNRDGSEILTRLKHYDGMMLLDEPADSSGAALALHWNGLSVGTDLPAFMALLEGRDAPLRLFDGDGLAADTSGLRVLGAPDTTFALPHGLLVGKSVWTPYLAAHLDSLIRTRNPMAAPGAWPRNCYNRWAAAHTIELLDRIPGPYSFDGIVYQDAFTYLRNWDYEYAASSIGASIFEHWLAQLTSAPAAGTENSPIDVDPIESFQRAVDELTATYGEDLSRWRLEVTRQGRRQFAGWPADSAFAPYDASLSLTRYAPLAFPGRGHPATLCWGAFNASDETAIASRWDSWSRRVDTTYSISWRRNEFPDSFLERYLISNRPSVSFSTDPETRSQYRTRLYPRS
jgi:hypothetical protein